MSFSLWILTILILLLMFGVGQRILDQMRLNDKQAIMLLVLIVIGILIPPIYIGKHFCFSIGGFLIPFGICVYLLCSAGKRDVFRAIIGTILVAGIIYGLEWLMPAETPEDLLIDPMFIYGIVSGIVAYSLGRSRRNAFICSILGVSLAMLVQFIINMAINAPTVLGLGVGGAFGTMIISAIISVALCEFLGRAFENAIPDKEKKVYNFETHTYDSEKNGRLNEDGTRALVVNGSNQKKSEKLTTQKHKVTINASKNNAVRTNKVKKGAKA